MESLGLCYKCDKEAYVTVGWTEMVDGKRIEHTDRVCMEHLLSHPTLSEAEKVDG